MDLDPLCQFLNFCGQPFVAVIMIDSSKACKLLVGVKVQSLYIIKRRYKILLDDFLNKIFL